MSDHVLISRPPKWEVTAVDGGFLVELVAWELRHSGWDQRQLAVHGRFQDRATADLTAKSLNEGLKDGRPQD